MVKEVKNLCRWFVAIAKFLACTMEKQPITALFRKETLARRSYFQLNLPRRADYYFAFWKKHPEVSWALLANEVSRNTGWLMSDIIRASRLAPYGMKIPGFPPAHYQAFFVFLEMGNFLIFRDMFPQLEAYDWAKRYPEYSDELFNSLRADPQFEVDPFIISHWKTFFKQAQANQWFPNWWQEPDVQRQAFAQIANEQNQIHDRLIHDPEHKYLGFFMSRVISQIFLASASLGLTKLCFPLAKSETNPTAEHLLVYTLTDFKSFENRVNIGRDLYVDLFGQERRRNRVIAWANANPHCRGTRVEYNPHNFSLHPRQAAKRKKYSPPLVHWQDHPPAWPLDATKMRCYSHLHDPPVPLPVTTPKRGPMVEALLNPLSQANLPAVEKPLTELAEVVIGNTPALQFSLLLQNVISKLSHNRQGVTPLRL